MAQGSIEAAHFQRGSRARGLEFALRGEREIQPPRPSGDESTGIEAGRLRRDLPPEGRLELDMPVCVEAARTNRSRAGLHDLESLQLYRLRCTVERERDIRQSLGRTSASLPAALNVDGLPRNCRAPCVTSFCPTHSLGSEILCHCNARSAKNGFGSKRTYGRAPKPSKSAGIDQRQGFDLQG